MLGKSHRKGGCQNILTKYAQRHHHAPATRLEVRGSQASHQDRFRIPYATLIHGSKVISRVFFFFFCMFTPNEGSYFLRVQHIFCVFIFQISIFPTENKCLLLGSLHASNVLGSRISGPVGILGLLLDIAGELSVALGLEVCNALGDVVLGGSGVDGGGTIGTELGKLPGGVAGEVEAGNLAQEGLLLVSGELASIRLELGLPPSAELQLNIGILHEGLVLELNLAGENLVERLHLGALLRGSGGRLATGEEGHGGDGYGNTAHILELIEC
jgi:hypothetical protein